MFSLVQAGKAVMPAQQVAEDRFVFYLNDATHVNHLTVFMNNPFPSDQIGCTVYFNFPGKPDWQLLGMLSNAKPSAIFRLRSAVQSSTSAGFQTGVQATDQLVATVGLHLQDLAAVEAAVASQQSSALVPAASSVNDTIVLANNIAKNLFNYLSSFSQNVSATGSNQVVGNYVDITLITKWLTSFESKTRGTGGTAWLSKD